jgi:integrase/recombinase XerC
MKENYCAIEQENIGPEKGNAANKHLGSKELANKTMAMIDEYRMIPGEFLNDRRGDAGKLMPDDIGVQQDEGEKASPLPGSAPEFPEQNLSFRIGSRWGETMEETAKVIGQYLEGNRWLADGTRRHHRYALERFLASCQKGYDQIEKADIRNFADELKRMGCKNSTINSYLAVLRSFYRYCFEENLVAKNPALPIRFLHVDDPIPHYLTPDELEQLQEVASDDLLERAIVETLYATGVRASELCEIQKEDINWDEKSIAIQKRKGWRGRNVYFHARCAARLKQYLASRQDDSPYLFVNRQGKPLKTAILDSYFRVLSRKLNFNVTPRMLRHTFAAHMAQKGMPPITLMQFLGQANILSTMIYTRFYAENVRNDYYTYL